MSNELQIFANGRVSVLTTRLFTADKFVRLAECNSLAEAVRLLADGGYGGGVVLSNPNDYDNMLRAETERLLAEFKELCVNVAARNFFLAQYDFVNAKVLMKAKYMRTDGVHGCFSEATFAPAKMQADFVDDNYADYPKAMAEGCDAVDARFAAGERAPSVVDAELDKAMFAYMKKCAAKSGISVVKKLCTYRIDATNIITIARAKKAGFDETKFLSVVIDGGKVKRDRFVSRADDLGAAPHDTLVSLWRANAQAASDLPDDVRAVWNALPDAARAEDVRCNKEFEMLTTGGDSLSVAPVLLYFARKSHETDLVRMIIIGVKNNLPKEEIKRRIVL